ncbi:hypothetical protein [Bacillus haynesii]|nr:hypothetical protein [Bacillus haynesii]
MGRSFVTDVFERMASNNSEILGELDGGIGRKPAATACFTAAGY